jgi:hypothetical protein
MTGYSRVGAPVKLMPIIAQAVIAVITPRLGTDALCIPKLKLNVSGTEAFLANQ